MEVDGVIDTQTAALNTPFQAKVETQIWSQYRSPQRVTSVKIINELAVQIINEDKRTVR